MTPRFSVAALGDLDGIWLYFAQDSPRAAKQLIDRLVAASEHVSDFPQIGVVREALSVGLRAFRADNYILFYAERPSV